MKSFLMELAEQLYAKYGNDISKLTILFPSRRARLFFNKALVDVAGGQPIWAPRFATIDELMCSISTLRSADPLRLVSELYTIYPKEIREDIDRFYHWGEMLIADFDMVDKYMVDAQMLFANIADIKEIESDISYLTEEQKMYLSRFWNTLNTEIPFSEQKEYFMRIWRALPSIYTTYKEHLRALGIGYTGMIYRDAAEKISQAQTHLLPDQKYVLAGFNALSACEQKLFDYLQSAHNAEFAWDYSDYYFYNHMQEAGRFIRSNVARYASTLNISHRDLTKCIKSLTVASAATSVAQCNYITQVLSQIAGRDENGCLKRLDRDTAIVLTDENLLLPLLYALPEEFKREATVEDQTEGVNVTMGYPLRTTFAYSFVERLLELQLHAEQKGGEPTFYYVDVEGLLTHPYLASSAPEQIAAIRKSIVDERLYHIPLSKLSGLPMAQTIFAVQSEATELISYIDSVFAALLATIEVESSNRLNIEYMVRIRTALRQIANMVESCNIVLPLKLCASLIRRHLQSVRIPFEGEPLEGLQIMGILETRNIDFKNVIVLSMSDSNFPGNKVSDKSYIPYSLRYAYNLPTQEHHQGVYGYYFYRLIERAENVWLVYCSTSDENGTGEPSRYIRQLEYESGTPINFVKVNTPIKVCGREPITIAKDSRALEVLSKYTEGRSTLSPTAFSSYVHCPLHFFYRYIANIKVEDNLEEGINNKDFGNIFHKAAEYLYQDVVGMLNPETRISKFTDEYIEQKVDQAIVNICFKGHTVPWQQFGGELNIVRRIVINYLKNNLIAYDVAHPGFVVTELETKFPYPVEFESNGKKLTVTIEGQADRVDSINDGKMIRIIDYKTGAEHLTFAGFDNLFKGAAQHRQSNTINTLMYAMITNRLKGVDVQPALYYLRDMHNKEYSPLLRKGVENRRSVPVENYLSVAEEFEKHIFAVLSEMFDPTVPFIEVEDENSCQYCDYAAICNRGKKRRD